MILGEPHQLRSITVYRNDSRTPTIYTHSNRYEICSDHLVAWKVFQSAISAAGSVVVVFFAKDNAPVVSQWFYFYPLQCNICNIGG